MDLSHLSAGTAGTKNIGVWVVTGLPNATVMSVRVTKNRKAFERLINSHPRMQFKFWRAA